MSTAAPEDVAPVAAALSEDKTLRERWQEKKKTGSAIAERVIDGHMCSVLIITFFHKSSTTCKRFYFLLVTVFV